ncbi:MAG: ABC transporter ATP-binding protein [Candidatus Marinimicrobia bacterium]|nr:ABC transporter ATP-binding protein [Candidatus Neomarinimicrobiota bacterium]|tara:strand:+ start:3202 stop:4086 length:885 start_codon:yes stop_codon:yes gene_type:complete
MIKSIKIDKVSKKFKNIHALNQITFDIPKNSVFGILGSNGSGKTTLMKILSGLIKSWSGNILLNNKKLNNKNLNLSKKFGFLIENPCFYEFLSARQNLEMLLRISDTKENRIDKIIELVSLSERQHDKVETFSYGMKQRLGLAQTLLHNPEIIVIDEPNNGLDPVGINEMNEILKNLQGEGKTIIISSHILSEIESLCTDICILRNGEILVVDSLENLKKNSNTYTIEVNNSIDALNELEKHKNIKVLKHLNNYITFSSIKELNINSINLIFKTEIQINQFKKDADLLKYFYAN